MITSSIRSSIARPLALALIGLALGACDAGDVAPVRTRDAGRRSDAGVNADDSGNSSVDPIPVDPGTPDPSDDAGTCGGTSASLSASTAEFLLVIDRSGSMQGPGTDGTDKWTALTRALTTVLPGLDDRISMGLVAFPDVAAGSAGSAMAACATLSHVDIEPAFHNSSRVLGVLSSTAPGGSTPTQAALLVAQQYFAAMPDSTSARYLLLATDGGPNCDFGLSGATCRCSSPDDYDCRSGGSDGASSCLDDARTVNAIRGLAAMGIQTFVVGLPGTESFGDVLDAMADAGGRPRSGSPRYYNASNTSDLTTALRSITSGLVDCHFHLESAPPDPSNVDVRLDGVGVPFDPSHRNGWDWTDDTHQDITFYGTACASVSAASGGEALTAAFGCPPTPAPG